jgi:hypothetical protein
MSGCTCGSIIWALKRTSDQPFPNGHVSRCAFTSPHSLNLRMAQSLACRMAGLPVSRGPYTSLNQLM